MKPKPKINDFFIMREFLLIKAKYPIIINAGLYQFLFERIYRVYEKNEYSPQVHLCIEKEEKMLSNNFMP